MKALYFNEGVYGHLYLFESVHIFKLLIVDLGEDFCDIRGLSNDLFKMTCVKFKDLFEEVRNVLPHNSLEDLSWKEV